MFNLTLRLALNNLHATCVFANYLATCHSELFIVAYYLDILSAASKKVKSSDPIRENHAMADAAIARMFFEAGIAFKPVESQSFVNMVDVLANLVDPKKGIYKPPSLHALSNNLLNAEVSIIICVVRC